MDLEKLIREHES